MNVLNMYYLYLILIYFKFSVYKHVDDLDLYVGGLLETPDVPDSILGPVFRCIVSRQFAVLKRGDRFFYDSTANDKAAFSILMLNEVRAVVDRIKTVITNPSLIFNHFY